MIILKYCTWSQVTTSILDHNTLIMVTSLLKKKLLHSIHLWSKNNSNSCTIIIIIILVTSPHYNCHDLSIQQHHDITSPSPTLLLMQEMPINKGSCTVTSALLLMVITCGVITVKVLVINALITGNFNTCQLVNKRTWSLVQSCCPSPTPSAQVHCS